MTIKHSKVGVLTRRENDVMTLAEKGMRVMEIADALGLSVNTIKFHKKHIYEKLRSREFSEASGSFNVTESDGRQGIALRIAQIRG